MSQYNEYTYYIDSAKLQAEVKLTEELLLSLFDDLFQEYIMMVAFSGYRIIWNDKTGWEELH